MHHTKNKSRLEEFYKGKEDALLVEFYEVFATEMIESREEPLNRTIDGNKEESQ